MPKSQRTPDMELQERYKVVQELIVQGFTGAGIAKWIAENTDWNITRRQAYNYYRDSFEALAIESNVNRAAYFKLALDRLLWLYTKAVESGDYKLANRVNNDLIAFLKLDQPSADFDWQKDAADKGLNPQEIVEALKRLSSPADELESSTDDTKAGSNGHG